MKRFYFSPLVLCPPINPNPDKGINFLHLIHVLPVAGLAYFFLQEKPRSRLLFLVLLAEDQGCHPFSFFLFTFNLYKKVSHRMAGPCFIHSCTLSTESSTCCGVSWPLTQNMSEERWNRPMQGLCPH